MKQTRWQVITDRVGRIIGRAKCRAGRHLLPDGAPQSPWYHGGDTRWYRAKYCTRPGCDHSETEVRYV